MLLRRKEEQKEEIIQTEEELKKRFALQIKKQKRRLLYKRICAGGLLTLIGIGGIKALFIGQQDPPYIQAINEYAFVEEYLDHYLHYPQTDSDKDYLNMFTLNNSWRCEYDNKGIETADLNTVSIYEAVVSENANVYYARVNPCG